MNSGKLNQEITKLISENKKFVLFKLPNQNKITLYAENASNKSSYGFVICDFENTQKHYISPEINLSFDLRDYNKNNIVEFKKMVNPFNFNYLTKLDYSKILKNVINLLNDKLIKVVIGRIIKWENKNFNELNHFINLSENSNSFTYLIYIPNTFCWIGSTPELLLNYTNNHLTTVSLAGTKKNNEQWTEKEFEEQRVVTDYIENLALQNNIKTTTGKLETIALKNEINHLKTSINSNEISYEKALSFLEKLHPTPAICGFPKDVALKLIKDLENQNRSFYTGYIGLEEKNNLQLYVNLRCAEVFKDFLNVYVGSGITKKSEIDKEWEETELKSKTIIFDC